MCHHQLFIKIALGFLPAFLENRNTWSADYWDTIKCVSLLQVYSSIQLNSVQHLISLIHLFSNRETSQNGYHHILGFFAKEQLYSNQLILLQSAFLQCPQYFICHYVMIIQRMFYIHLLLAIIKVMCIDKTQDNLCFTNK